jgi:hypothetical protein
MRKIVTALLIMTFVVFGTAYAKEEGFERKVMGKIAAVDKNNKVVTVTDVNGKEFKLAVLPNTELEFKFRRSIAVFDNLSEGQWVEADYIIGSPLNTAREIEIHDK